MTEATVDAMTLAREERQDLAAFLATLSDEDWLRPSLCEDWTVRDVVAHVTSYEELSTPRLLWRLVKGRVIRANQIGVDAMSGLSPADLRERLEAHLDPQGLTAGFGGMIALTDATIHHQDIRRALGRPRDVPTERLLTVLESVPTNPRLGAWRRIRGLRLRATDLGWTHGDGPEVTGPGEALLMAMSGRGEAVTDLAGPGLETLRTRLAASG